MRCEPAGHRSGQRPVSGDPTSPAVALSPRCATARLEGQPHRGRRAVTQPAQSRELENVQLFVPVGPGVACRASADWLGMPVRFHTCDIPTGPVIWTGVELELTPMQPTTIASFVTVVTPGTVPVLPDEPDALAADTSSPLAPV